MKRPYAQLALMLFALAIISHRFARADCLPQEPIKTFVYVALTVKDGRLAVDRDNSYFTPAPGVAPKPAQGHASFKCPAPMNDDRLKTVILDYLDQSFAKLPRLYWFGLTQDQQQSLETKHDLDVADLSKLDQRARDLRSYNAKGLKIKWTDFYNAFKAWAPNKSTLDDVFDTLFPAFIQNAASAKGTVNLNQSTPLTFDNSDSNGYFAPDGVMSFGIPDPVCDWHASDYQIVMNGAPASQSDAQTVNSILKSFRNRFWIAGDITQAISEYFLSRGQGVEIMTSEPGAPKKITITQIRIARIKFPYQSASDDKITNEIMYLLMPDQQFRTFDREPFRASVLARPGPLAGYKSVDYCHDFKLCDGRQPLLNQLDLQRQQLQIKQLGYTVAQQRELDSPKPEGQGGGFKYVALTVTQDQKTPVGTGSGAAPRPAATKPAPNGSIDAKNAVADVIPPAPVPQGGDAPPSPAKKKPNFLGGGLDYRPGQGVRPFVLVQRSGLFSRGDSLSGQLGASGQAFGSLSYDGDFILFNQLKRRLSFQVTGSSDSEAGRVFAGVKTAERRTGGSARADLELFRDRNHQQLGLYVEGDDVVVKETPQVSGARKHHLATLDLGGQYRYESQNLSHPVTLWLQPRMRFGLGLASDDHNFSAFRLLGNFHQIIGNFLAADVSVRSELDSKATPIFEEASFGGPETVRGFRRDDEIGRRLWSVQNELWIPLPRLKGIPRLDKIVRDGLRIAPFVDAGGVYQTLSNHDGVRGGAGAGFRYIHAPVVFKLDWGYGLGTVSSGAGHGRVYFSIGTTLPF
jgi:hypothetical protein